jgi:hypothetical protein
LGEKEVSISILIGQRRSFTWEAQTQTDAIRKVYHRAVAIPLMDVEQIWREYDGFENKLNKMTVSTVKVVLPRMRRDSRITTTIFDLNSSRRSVLLPAQPLRAIGTILVCVICLMNCDGHKTCVTRIRPKKTNRSIALANQHRTKTFLPIFLVSTCPSRSCRPRNSLPSVLRST